MRTSSLRMVLSAGLLAVAAVLPGCSKTEDGQMQVEVPDVDIKVGRDTVTVPRPNLPDIDVGSKRDTVTTPTIGTKRTEVQRPTADVKRP